MNYILDTNILIHLLRQNNIATQIERDYQIFNNEHNAIISVVTIGELKSIAKMNNWTLQKILLLDNIINQFLIADINRADIIEKYAEIDAFSQGKLVSVKFTARNMGKNDLWIAATAAVLDGVLLTTDKDFNHLDNIFFNLAYLQ
jgi:tRNA(fMet)-specific endonuclease VapC